MLKYAYIHPIVTHMLYAPTFFLRDGVQMKLRVVTKQNKKVLVCFQKRAHNLYVYGAGFFGCGTVPTLFHSSPMTTTSLSCFHLFA